jgi:glycine hydroxymethyltransferase
MLDWRDFGRDYAAAMIRMARALAEAMQAEGLPVFEGGHGPTRSHQFALMASDFGGGQTAARKLRRAGFLASGIGLPVPEVQGDMNGLRLGTPEIVRWGMTEADAPRMARLVAKALSTDDPDALAPEVSEWRKNFDQVHFVHA